MTTQSKQDHFNVATKAQILQVQGAQIIKYVATAIQWGKVDDKTCEKFQKLFDVVNEK